MLKIGVVGDCSQGDPDLLAKALDAALAASDVVVQVGDIHSNDDHTSYDVMTARMASGKLLCVPGNHDYQSPGGTNFFAQNPKQWRKDYPEATLIGLDNAMDNFGPGWDILNNYAASPRTVPLFLFMHKSLSTLVLPDGTESNHVMGEGSTSAEGDKLKVWLTGREATVCVGHYHGAAMMMTPYGCVILEGRGGAGGYGTAWSPSGTVCGYTLILVQPEGWTAHQVSL